MIHAGADMITNYDILNYVLMPVDVQLAFLQRVYVQCCFIDVLLHILTNNSLPSLFFFCSVGRFQRLDDKDRWLLLFSIEENELDISSKVSVC